MTEPNTPPGPAKILVEPEDSPDTATIEACINQVLAARRQRQLKLAGQCLFGALLLAVALGSIWRGSMEIYSAGQRDVRLSAEYQNAKILRNIRPHELTCIKQAPSGANIDLYRADKDQSCKQTPPAIISSTIAGTLSWSLTGDTIILPPGGEFCETNGICVRATGR